MQTTGAGANAVMVQSIGGGGGYALAFNGAVQTVATGASNSGAGGDGGAVSATINKAIQANGAGSAGLIVQSAGGGGGIVGAGVYSETLGSSPFAGTAGRTGRGGAVNAAVNANIVVTGTDASAVVLQSVGGSGNGNIDLVIAAKDTVLGGSGAGVGVRVLDGATNSLVNHGDIASAAMIDGEAILAGNGNEAVDSDGVLVGSIDLGTGANSLLNRQAGAVYSGTLIFLGAGNVFTNQGLLSPGGQGRVLTTLLTGNYVQSPTGVYGVDLDFARTGKPGEADRLNATGTASLSGQIDLDVLNKAKVLPGDHTVVIVNATGGVSQTGLSLAAPVSAIAAFNLRYPDLKDVQLGYTIDFAPTGLNRNETAVGQQFNAVQLAGGNTAFDKVISAIFDIPSVGLLANLYDRLTPEPYVQQVDATRLSSELFTDRLFSCSASGGQTMTNDRQSCAWLRTDVRDYTARRTSQYLEGDETETGMSGGFETGLGHGWRVGFGLSYESGTAKADTSVLDNYATQNGNRVQGGAVLKKAGDWGDLALAVTGGVARYSVSRNIDFQAGGVLGAEGKQKLSFGTASVRYGKTYGDARGWIRPSIGLEVTRVQSDAVREHNGGPVDLEVRSKTSDAWRVRPSIEVGRDWKVAPGLWLRPTAKVGVNQTLAGRNIELDSVFEATPAGVGPFATRERVDQTTGEAGVGIALVDDRGASLRLGASSQFGDRTHEEMVQVKLVVPF